jgi:hypothetical protein
MENTGKIIIGVSALVAGAAAVYFYNKKKTAATVSTQLQLPVAPAIDIPVVAPIITQPETVSPVDTFVYQAPPEPVQEIVRVPIPAWANPETYTPEIAPELEKGNFGFDPEPIGNLNEGYGWKEQSSWGTQFDSQFGANTQYYPSDRPAYMNNGYRPAGV